MAIKIFDKKETQEILNKLRSQFGIKEILGQILQIGKERLFIYQGSLTKREIYDLDAIIPIERVGVYFAKYQNDKIRLSIEGTHIFKDQITKNIFELSNDQTDQWMHGSEILVNSDKNDFLVMKNNEDLLGTGKASSEKITNFIPKTRRLKFKERKN